MLADVQAELENIKWTTSDELKSKQRDIDIAREEIRRQHALRDEAIETQRRDMTAAFEKIISQRDGSFAQREDEIATQINALESRIDNVQQENIRLRGDISNLSRIKEKLSGEVDRKEDQIRQLNWRYEDASANWKKVEDQLQRSLQQALDEVELCRDSLMKQISDSQHELDRVCKRLNFAKSENSIIL
jgi:chromosome segregation ATPase